MAFNAGVTKSTGDLIDAPDWNKYMGASGSIDFLKTEVDTLDDVSQSVVTGSRDIASTVFQNTSGKIRIATVVFETTNGATLDAVQFLSDSSTPPTTSIGIVGKKAAQADPFASFSFTFVVVPSNYYKAANLGSASLTKWVEYDLH